MKDIKKIVVIGPESTGKSTLASALAASLGTLWVPEYAREYLTNLGRPYFEADMTAIAAAQVAAEEAAVTAAQGPAVMASAAAAVTTDKYLICDTDLYVIKVWSEAKYGRCHPWILEQIATRKYDLYLLTSIDMPWEDDPLREHPQPHERAYFYNIYKDIVAQSGVPWAVVSGNEEERLQAAIKAIQNLL